MRLLQLRYFLEVCKYSNITKASESLHVAQPTITVAIKDLEHELGISLFHRVKQRLYLTEEGEYLQTRLNDIIHDLDALTEDVRSMANSKTNIKIGIPPMMGSFLFPIIFSKLQSVKPNVHLEIVERGALEVQELLKKEQLDIAMLIEENLSQKDISFKAIMKSSLMLVTNTENPLAKYTEISMSQLSKENLVLFDESFYVNQVIMESFSKINIKPNIILETSQLNTIKSFAREGIASSILIGDCILPEDNLVKVKITDLDDITIGIGYKESRILSNDFISLINFMSKL